MLHLKTKSLLPAFVLLGIAPAPPDESPEIPRDVRLASFRQTEATDFRDLFGQAVLLDFFASWCAPCARQVPHLNAVQDEYRDEGLIVLGVTGEPEEKSRPWVEKHSLEYAYALDPDLALQIELGFRPLPFAVLLDPMGAVVWYGHPESLKKESLDAATEHALSLPLWRWPEPAAALRESLRQGRYAEARERVGALEASELKDEVEDLLERIVEHEVAVAEAAFARGDLLTALERAREIESALEGDLLRRARSIRTRIEESEESRETVDRLRRLREVWRTVASVGSKQEANALLDRIAALREEAPGTFVETRARSHEAAIRSFMVLLR